MGIKSEELAFVNRQLAAMLKSGLPLEGGLRQMCAEMRRGRLRDELRALEAELAEGKSLDEALGNRRLPELYTRMLRAGARSQDLPQMLTLLADYYYEQHNLWSRLKALMVYPTIVLVGCLFLSGLCGVFFTRLVQQEITDTTAKVMQMQMGASLPAFTSMVLQHKTVLSAAIWTPAFMLSCILLGFVLANLVPAVRRWLRFHLPILRDTAFAQFASSMGLMLQGGCPLRDCVAVLGRIEGGSSLGRELAGWETRLQAGAAKFLDVAGPKGLLPPFFKWLVASAGEDLPGGFRQAAELYRTRALRARDMILYAALPVSTVVLGGIIAVQVYCIFLTLMGLSLPLISMMDGLGF